MQPIFTLQYAEYMVAEKVTKMFKDVSIFVPTSSQEKGIDLIIYRRAESENRTVTIQVKSSRVHFDDKKYVNTLWLHRFVVQENADLFFLTGLYGRTPEEKDEITTSAIKWDMVILVFTNEEMKDFLENIKLKNTPEKYDSYFNFSFDDPKKIYLTRGNPKVKDVSHYLIENRKDLIKEMLGY